MTGMEPTYSWKILSDDKLSDGAKETSCRVMGILSDKWRKLSEEWWVMEKKKKIQAGPKSVLG